MSTISFDLDAAKALLFVAKGAAKTDHESVLFLDFSSDGTCRITTSDNSNNRSADFRVDDSVSRTYAIRAAALVSVASKVDDEQSMSLTARDNKIHVSCGATSASLTDLYEVVVDSRLKVPSSPLTTVEAYTSLSALSHAASAVNKNGKVILADDGNGMSIGSGSDDVYTQELLPATLLGGTDEYRVSIYSGLVKPLKELGKIETLDSVEINSGKGILEFLLPVHSEETSLKEVSYTTPTVVSTVVPTGTPCDEDVDNILSVDSKTLKGAMDSISGVVSDSALITLDATQDNRVVVKVADEESTGKNVIVDAVVYKKSLLTTTISSLKKALQTAGSGFIIVGCVNYKEEEWVTISPEFDDEAESEADNSDIIVAIRTAEEPIV